MSDFFKETSKAFLPEMRDPNQTLEQWVAEILINSNYERKEIPVKAYERGYSAKETIEYMMETGTRKAPGRPRQNRDAKYVNKRIANLIWQDCSKMFGGKLTGDGRQLVIQWQEWAEANGSTHRAATGNERKG